MSITIPLSSEKSTASSLFWTLWVSYSSMATIFPLQMSIYVETADSPAVQGKLLTNLPPYPWIYDSHVLWNEGRQSLGLRERKHGHHDLLGLQMLGGSGIVIKALPISFDQDDKGAEIFTTLGPLRISGATQSNKWHDFEVSTYNDSTS